MKTARETLEDNLSPLTLDALGENELESIVKAMKIYAERALNETSRRVEADFEAIDNDLQQFMNDMEEGEDYEVSVSRESILQIKNELE